MGNIVEMIEKKRKPFNSLQKKKLQQEAGSRCPFCGNADAASWEYHHIDGDSSNSVLENGIMVCGSCHNHITKGEISEADVRLRKNIISWEFKQGKRAIARSVGNETPGNVQQNSPIFFNTGSVVYAPTQVIRRTGRKNGRETKFPVGTIGADTYANGYIAYLAKKAAEAQNNSGIKATPAKFYVQFEMVHGLTPLRSRIDKLDVAIEFLQKTIDRTPFAKSLGHKFYHSFEEHKQIIDNPRGKKGIRDSQKEAAEK